MYKGITLNQFIGELQKLAVEHGNDEISSIGSSSGKIAGMSSPFCFNFKGHDATEFVAAYQQDVKAMPSQGLGVSGQGLGMVSAEPTDFNGAKARGIDEVRYAQDLHKKWMEGALRNVWARVGMSLLVTPEEEKAIFEGDYLDGKEAVMKVIEAGRASIDGETYIPQECIEDFDDAYGTHYQKRDEECAWTMDGEYVNAGGKVPGPANRGDKVVSEVLADAAARQTTADAVYKDAMRELVQSGKAEEILNSPKAQALREGKARLAEGYQMNNDDFVK